MKRGGGGAICRLSGRIAVTLGSFRKRMAPSRQCNGATGRNRIIDEFSMPAHEAFDGLPITNRSGCRLGLFAGALIRVLSFSITGCNERCLTTPKLRLWDAAEWVTRCA